MRQVTLNLPEWVKGFIMDVRKYKNRAEGLTKETDKIALNDYQKKDLINALLTEPNSRELLLDLMGLGSTLGFNADELQPLFKIMVNESNPLYIPIRRMNEICKMYEKEHLGSSSKMVNSVDLTANFSTSNSDPDRKIEIKHIKWRPLDDFEGDTLNVVPAEVEEPKEIEFKEALNILTKNSNAIITTTDGKSYRVKEKKYTSPVKKEKETGMETFSILQKIEDNKMFLKTWVKYHKGIVTSPKNVIVKNPTDGRLLLVKNWAKQDIDLSKFEHHGRTIEDDRDYDNIAPIFDMENLLLTKDDFDDHALHFFKELRSLCDEYELYNEKKEVY